MPGPGDSGDIHGRRWTKRYRLRPGLFGVVLEQLVIEADGTGKWRRPILPVELT